ncbi:MAG: helix-turn-helix domain-containing protein [Nitrospinaceae bacterium]|nr:helix-turn-helix domain-containing protein [Nitrospinaceae bacterium]MBT3435065.1 helix-turn-helix domain-containing protein [Nitrospinaceae bacterium]MBT3821823.1 helix-turn-helix domain-containing protein [Nitrospinaceae bacterium]MBT4094628.1 helix-turn-helix domain-containing protein [Nitrospinaceae bacterium]MBT4429335.1 helix-turn-helix domain-containing protein [Nitrospinaceae bacterium]
MMKNLSMERKREIGKRLQKVRESLGLSQAKFANTAGVSAGTISLYEKGRTETSVSFLEYLNREHGISSNWVLFGTGMMKIARKEKKGTMDGRPHQYQIEGPAPFPQRVKAFEKFVIEEALIEHKGNVQDTMKTLGIPRRTLNDKMDRYGIDRKDIS